MTTFAEIETKKNCLLTSAASWPEERLLFRPTPVEWSVVEMFDHLVRTESAILDAARSGLAHPHRIGVSDRMRTAFLSAIFCSRRRVKIPGNVPQILPGSALRLDEVGPCWDVVREDLRLFLDTTPDDLLRQGIFKHPVGGWMNISGILVFFYVHMITAISLIDWRRQAVLESHCEIAG